MSPADHTGLIPIFNERNGFNGTIYASKPTIEITKELLKDCCFIHKKNIEYLKAKGKKRELIYNEVDLYNCFEHMKYMPVNEVVEIDSNFKVEFRHNSHVVGSCNATFYIKEYKQNRWKTVVYSSDMGSQINYKYTPYLKEQDIPTKCNLFISEATYSNNSREMTSRMAKEDRKELLNIIKEGLLNGRRILLPVFAFSKAQTMATFLVENLQKEEWFMDGGFEIVMDGLLMNNINSVYSRVLEGEDKERFDKVMNFDRLRIIKEYPQTIEFLKEHKPSIILASSGFLENGKISVYLPYIVGNSKDVIVINGYCSQDCEGSIANKLLNEKQKTITFNMEGEKRTVYKKCKIYQQKSWSSHISNKELKELFASIDCDKILVHHCDEDNKEQFIAECKEFLRSKNKTTPITAVSKCATRFKL